MAGNSAAAPEPLAGKHLYLAGYRGSGKSSVGRLLAEKLGRPWIDCDDQIEAEAGKSIREIFDRGGEAAFRDLEAAAIKRIAQQPCAVISLGGGAVLRETNRAIIAATGLCVWLQVDAQTALQRLNDDRSTEARRPALTHLPQLQEIEALMAARAPLYEQVSHYRVDTAGNSIGAIVAAVLQQIFDKREAPSPTDTCR